ncbi:hypothetical protein SPRG_06344 [Saprolegnia parasitica CBS 223.65]|uniref:DUF7726 domain-containing protein n=1 Tax=Saprolegnia parasitica (strain CBS 223.65) TaxID=695850 RepID=A0A067CC12_SAPPC|nr:hypothetical protein SPRG_06344 [Saprolegnia parasitica CBS 223.65]KDO28294.1 hypothetical protein SPRG_06344 [Saprolegnia parasitica CBS 223.65]|eukprot:XP_012201113.1 hypothetical protein SPRG_06344 [Saprolegnia parasitica CBS 223.65]
MTGMTSSMTAAAPPAAGRSFLAAPTAATPGDESEGEDEYQERLARRWSCNAIRLKIQKFLATKVMTQTAFLKAIRSNANSYQRFMKQTGVSGGSGNQTYWNSLPFFDELAKKEKKEKADAKKTGAKRKADTTTDEAPRAKKSASGSDRLAEIDAVELDEDAPVYDDCDVVRDHLQQFFLAKEASQVNLAKHLGFSITPLRNFLMKKGRREGSGSAVYGAAYRFFEKRRLLDGVPKSAKRLKIEKTLPEGYPLRKDPTHYYLLPGEEVPVLPY